MKHILLIFIITLSVPLFAEENWLTEAKSYIKSHPGISEDIKQAILNGKVILGMCPNEAIAAAGRPGPYKIIKDNKWASDVPPPIVAMKQCEEPDNSIIEFLFKNDRQFENEMTVFHVRFEKGKAVIIDKNGFSNN